MKFTKPILFSEAVDRLGQRTVVASGLDSHDWAFRVPAALRERAFFSSHVESAQFLQRTKDALTDFLVSQRETVQTPDGESVSVLKTGSRAAFIDRAREFALSEGMGTISDDGRGGLKDITSRKRLGLIFDVQTQSAHDFGYWKQGNDPRILDEFPAQRFVREAAVKQKRALHEQNEGVVRLKSDLDFWLAMNSVNIGGFGVPYGPWGFNSGMGVEDVDRDEAEQLGLLAAEEKVESPEVDWNDRLRASARNLDPEVQGYLKDAFGDQVEIVDGAAHWKNTQARPSSPRQSSPEPAPAPAPDRPVPPPQSTSSMPKVSSAFDLPTSGKVRASAGSALAAIDSVHSDGKLGTVPVQPLVGGRGRGGTLGLTSRDFSGRIRAIGVRASGPWPELTTVHEVGHVLDWVVLGGGRGFGSEADTIMGTVMSAISRSAAVARLRIMATEAADPDLADRIVNYLLSRRELWARAYAQYIAEKSNDRTLVKNLSKRLAETGPQQWEADDFAPIRGAIDDFFRSRGWL